MAYGFDQIFAADPANPANIAQNAAITIYAPGDVTMTPLTLTDPSGGALTNPIQVNANGFGSAFQHATLDRVAWSGGGFTGFFTSYEGMKDEAVAAREAAESAAATAGAEAAAVADAAIGDATAEATAAKSAAETAATNAAASATAAANSAALVGAPADTAIAAAVNGNGATKTALNATYLDLVSEDTPVRAAVANAPILPKPRTARPMVAFTFDDSPAVDYTVIRPILEARGVRGTFACLLSAMGTTETRWTQLREMVANGHEVVNHSATHVQLDAASSAVLDAEIEGAHATFVSRGVTPKGFIPPNNAGSVEVRRRVRALGYRYMMGGEQGRAGANPQPVVTYSMSRIAMDSNTLLATTQAQIDAAKAGNYLLTYVIHGGTLNAAGQTVLGQTIDYAIAQGVEVVTVSEGLDAVGNVYESGDFAGKAVGATYTVIDGQGKLHGHQTDKVTDTELVSKVRDQAPISAGMPSRTIMVNDRALGLSFQKTFTGAAEQTISIPLPNMGMFHMMTVDLSILSQQFYTNSGIRCVYGAKLFCAVGSGDSIRVQPHPYLTASGFTVAPVVTMIRDATTKVTSLQVVFTPATADGSGVVSATIAV